MFHSYMIIYYAFAFMHDITSTAVVYCLLLSPRMSVWSIPRPSTSCPWSKRRCIWPPQRWRSSGSSWTGRKEHLTRRKRLCCLQVATRRLSVVVVVVFYFDMHTTHVSSFCLLKSQALSDASKSESLLAKCTGKFRYVAYYAPSLLFCTDYCI